MYTTVIIIHKNVRDQRLKSFIWQVYLSHFHREEKQTIIIHLDGHTTKIKSRAKTPSASSVVNVTFPSFSLSTAGQVLAVGENGMAQLGLKSAISQRQNPQPVPLPELVIQIASGPLHSVCLTEKNQIFTFGCNDEHALGRIDNNDDDDDEADQFGLVDMSGVMDINQEKIIQVVAGDSHTLVLSDAGKVYGNKDF
jgi:regulator of chromosome condensation